MVDNGEVESQVRPEVLLGRFNNALLQLRASLLAIGDSSVQAREDDEVLVETLRHTDLADMLEGLYLVAVTGAHGVGKTTLVSQIYGLTEIEGNLGRGELMPIVIRERTNLAATRTWLRVLAPAEAATGGSPEQTRDSALQVTELQDVNLSRWRRATRGLDAEALVVGLDVPATFFGADGAGFLLLPGYEPRDGENPVWQNQMRGALIASPAAIVVTDASSLARNDHERIVEDLNALYLDNVRPVIAVTKTEGLTTAERRAVLEQQAAGVFGGAPLDDVVLTGVGERYREAWLSKLRARLDRDRRSRRELRASQMRHLKDVVQNTPAPVMQHAREILLSSAVITDDFTKYMSSFEEGRTKAKVEYRRAIDKLLADQRARADELVASWTDAHGGWKGTGDAVKDWLSIRSDQRARERVRRVVGMWNEAGGELGAVRSAHLLRIEQNLGGERAIGSEQDLPAASGSQTESALVLPSSMQKDLLFIAGFPEEEDPSRDFEVSLRVLPSVALEVLRFSTQAHGVSMSHPQDAGGPEHVTSLLSDMRDTQLLLLTGFIGMVGIDFAMDGTVGLIPGLAQAFQSMIVGPAAATAPVAGMLATASAAAVVAVAAVGAGIAVANKSAARASAVDDSILQAAQEQTEKQLWDAFDQVMDVVEDALKARLRAYCEVDEGRWRLLNLERALAVFKSTRGDVLEAIGAVRTVA